MFLPTLYLEVDGELMRRAGDSPDDLFAWLERMGYRGFVTPGSKPAQRYEGAGDYLFVAAGKTLT